jgi:CRISPR-associated protein (TIGR02710 family)
MTRPHVLLCTVGTGTVDQLQETLLTPLKKSIGRGEWQRVILLPSQLTHDYAALLRDELRGVPIEVRPLPRAGAEDDPDACFAHFDAVLAEVRSCGAAPADVLVDFTRGTKVMSAALVLAAVRHDLPLLRYISGPRGPGGMVLPGAEVVADVHAAVVGAHKRLDEARLFFRRGLFPAASGILDNPGPGWPAEHEALARRLGRWAAFYAAWDRLDYRAAAASPWDEGPAPPDWARFAPTAAMGQWVRGLAEPFPEPHPERATRLRRQAVDLLANAERRLRDHHYEDVVVRAYRVLELVGQIRLFDRGLDSAAMPAAHPQVQAFQEKLVKGKSVPLEENRKQAGTLLAAREQVARLLKFMGDPLGARLSELGQKAFVRERNRGLFIHGFESLGSKDAQTLHESLGELEQLVRDDGGPDTESNLQVARSCDFSP